MMDEDDKLSLEIAENKLKEVLTYLLCLQSEEAITANTYTYLSNQLLDVLRNNIQLELYNEN